MPNCKYDDPRLCDARHIKELETLAEIARTLSSKSKQEEILLEVIDLLEQSRSVQRGTIMLLTADGRELRVEAAKGINAQQASGKAYRRGEGITGQVLETGMPRIVPLVAEEPRFKGRLHDRSNEPLSFICVPINIENEPVGTLSVDCKAQGMPALEELLRFLSIVATMIANDVSARRIARMEREALENENLRLRTEMMEKFQPENMIGNSHLMHEVYTRIHQVAASDTTVLIRGESGTGKELVAAAIHYSSNRAKKPFVKVNCAALNENLLESELFGHEKGAFTGALQTRIGRVQEAEGGTLFLDEIGDFSRPPRSSYCACCRNGPTNASAVTNSARRTYGLLRPPMPILKPRFWRTASGRICFTASMSFRSICLPCVRGATTSCCSPTFS